MPRRVTKGSRVVITGASSGIGAALARRLAQRGARLMVTARREERLQQLADELRSSGSEVAICAGDLTNAAHRATLASRIEAEWQGLDWLVNNAGVGAVGRFADADAARLRRIMEVNFFAPVELTRALLPPLQRGQRPVVVNIGSVLGHVAVPKKSEYCASKFALRGWTDALRCELKPIGIDVLWVAPNTTRSEFFDQLLERQGEVAENRWSMSPEQVAQAVERAIERGRQTQVLTLSGRALLYAGWWMPKTLHRLLARFG